MAAPAPGSKSLKEYLKRYESNTDEEKKKKKKKKKAKPVTAGVLVVDEDPVWQKPVNLQEEEGDDDSADEVKPQIDEDIEVKRMRRLEQLRLRRPYNAIGEDGSGWVSLSSKSSNLEGQTSDISPPRRGRIRNDTPSSSPDLKTYDADLSPPRVRERCQDSPSPEPSREAIKYSRKDSDMSPPRRKRARNDTPSPDPNLHTEDSHHFDDLSPPRRVERNRHRQSQEMSLKSARSPRSHDDISPPRRRRARADTPSPEPNLKRDSDREDNDLSPPRQRRPQRAISPEIKCPSDLSPPQRSHQKGGMIDSSDLSPPRKGHRGSQHEDKIQPPPDWDLSPPRRGRKDTSVPVERRKMGLVSGKDISKEMAETRKDELLRTDAMDPSLTGKGAEPVYRDKKTGARLSKEEFLKLQEKKKEKPKEIDIEWGKGLAQKREAEERMRELELEKDKPFARTRDDEELNRMLKERIRWGDPMAHLVKRKQLDPLLPDFGDSEKMKESGFVIPQDVPSHSWLKRGLDAAPNRYGIRPGRHWDGVDRSNGYEKELFKRTNEKRATEREAYLWSVSDM